MLKLPRLWSLADMIEHFAMTFGIAYSNLLSLIVQAHQLDKENHVKPVQDRLLSKDRLRFLAGEYFHPIMGELDRMGMDDLAQKGKRLHHQIVSDINTWTADRLLDSVRDFRRDLDVELNKHRFALLNAPNDKYFEQEKLFGEVVFNKLKPARKEIMDAGNAFACELYTACVFHLTRATEHGLRKIAKRLNVTIADKGKNIPLEYGEWNKVIEAVGNKILETRKTANNSQKQARLNYYADGLERCSAMKDLFRNEVSHTRKRYNYGEALGAFERVRDFMQFLARPVPR